MKTGSNQTPSPRHSRAARRGFTLTETLIVMATLGVVMVAFGMFSSQALRTYKWLTATNISHQQARQGIQRMLGDIHSSPSPVMLVNIRGETAPTAQTFWGVVYQRLMAGPLEVSGSLDVGDTSMTLVTGDFTPEVGQLIIIPNSNNLYAITSVDNSASNTSTVDFAPGIQSADSINVPSGYNASDAGAGGGRVISVFISQRSAFVVRPSSTTGSDQDLELRYYPTILSANTPQDGMLMGQNDNGGTSFFVPMINNAANNNLEDPRGFDVVSRGLRGVVANNNAVAPFSDPAAGSGQTNRRALAAVQLSLQDSSVSDLIDDEESKYHLNATTIFLNSAIPQKELLTSRH